jgi:hypothetical protein
MDREACGDSRHGAFVGFNRGEDRLARGRACDHNGTHRHLAEELGKAVDNDRLGELVVKI